MAKKSKSSVKAESEDFVKEETAAVHEDTITSGKDCEKVDFFYILAGGAALLIIIYIIFVVLRYVLHIV
jgi:hypothetical protein